MPTADGIQVSSRRGVHGELSGRKNEIAKRGLVHHVQYPRAIARLTAKEGYETALENELRALAEQVPSQHWD